MFLEKVDAGVHMLMPIENRDDLYEHFRIDQLDGILSDPGRADSYIALLPELEPSTAVETELLSHLVNQGGRCVYRLNPTQNWFRGGRIDAPALLHALEHYAEALKFFRFCDDETNEMRIRELAKMVSFEDEAALLFLFMLLHIQARRPIDQAGMSFMRARLESTRRACLLPRKPLSLPPGTLNLTLSPCAAEAPAVIREIQGGWLPLFVQLEGTPFRRTLLHGDTLLMLETGGAYPVFFPRRDGWDDITATRYSRSLLPALAQMPGDPDDPPVVPVLCGGVCVLALTRSGRAVAGGKTVAEHVFSAAADDAYFYFGLKSGVAYMPRGGGPVNMLCQTVSKTHGPVEEIDVRSGTLFWRRADSSKFFSMPAPSMPVEPPNSSAQPKEESACH